MMRTHRAIFSGLVIAACFAACTLNTRPSLGSGGSPISGEAGDSGNGGRTAEPRGGESSEGGRGGSTSSAAGTSAPPPKKNDGETCAADVDCMSNHCIKNICCAGGDCCRAASDCPGMTVDGISLQCNEPSKCQGMGGTAVCREFRCMAEGGAPNDTPCTNKHLAKDCGPYPAVYCSGAMEQQEPVCATSCKSDDDCDSDAHCNASKACVADAADGSQCLTDNECQSKHCSNQICCKEGDCCTSSLSCGAYAGEPMCTDVTKCAGSQKVGVCSNFQCKSEEMKDNDACNGMEAMTCDKYAPARCIRGGLPICATACMVPTHCATGFYCEGGQCQPRRPDGSACQEEVPNQCQTKCNKGFCCSDSGPDSYCCGTDADCAMLQKSSCSDNKSCNGNTTTAKCSSNHRCNVTTRPDPAACTQTLQCPEGFAATTAMCPILCGCKLNTECTSGFVCDRSNGPPGNCVKDTSLGGAGAAGGAAGMSGGGAAGAAGASGLLPGLGLDIGL